MCLLIQSFIYSFFFIFYFFKSGIRIIAAVHGDTLPMCLLIQLFIYSFFIFLFFYFKPGIRIIAAVHGDTLPMLLHDPQRAALAGVLDRTDTIECVLLL